MNKIKQLPVPQETVAKEKDKPSKTNDWLQMCLKVSTCALEETLLSSSQRAQVAENQI